MRSHRHDRAGRRTAWTRGAAARVRARGACAAVSARLTRRAPRFFRGREPEFRGRVRRDPRAPVADDRRFGPERALAFFQPPNAGNRGVRPASLGAQVLTGIPRTPHTADRSSRALIRARRGGPHARSRARGRALRLRLRRIRCVTILLCFARTRAFRATISRTHRDDRGNAGRI